MNAIRLALVATLLAPSAFAHSGKGHPNHRWDQDARGFRSYQEVFSLPQNSSSATRAPVEKIDAAYLEESLRMLTGEKDATMANRKAAAGRAAARAFLRQEFTALGYTVTEEAYSSGSNLVAEKAGRSGKFLIVSAHYDSVGNAGADDDGTGTVALLGTAKLLGDRVLENGVRFVAFDEEELGLVGSKAYVRDLGTIERASIIGNLQIEMLGYNSKKDGKFHVISCDRPDSQFLVDAFTTVVANAGTGLQITRSCTDRSDHASFWDANIPAIVISQNFFGGDANPCYHRACDKIDGVDFRYFQNTAEAAANVVIQIATTAAPTTPPRAPSEPPRQSQWPKSAR